MKQALKTLHNFLVFFLLVAAVITCCLMLFTSTLQDSIGRAFTQVEITAAAKATMVNVIVISAVMALGDYLRRKFTVERPAADAKFFCRRGTVVAALKESFADKLFFR